MYVVKTLLSVWLLIFLLACAAAADGISFPKAVSGKCWTTVRAGHADLTTAAKVPDGQLHGARGLRISLPPAAALYAITFSAASAYPGRAAASASSIPMFRS